MALGITHAPIEIEQFLNEKFLEEEWLREGVQVGDHFHKYVLGHHFGYDLGNANQELYVPGPGKVMASGFPEGAFGNRATIKLDSGVFFHHNHMRDPARIAVGTRVEGGELIGFVGATGNTGGPHDHLTVTTANTFVKGVFVDPGPALRELQEDGGMADISDVQEKRIIEAVTKNVVEALTDRLQQHADLLITGTKRAMFPGDAAYVKAAGSGANLKKLGEK